MNSVQIRSRVFTGAPSAREVARTGRVITVVTWLLTGAVVAVSMSTAAPFIDAHSEGYATGPLLALAVDGCFILGLQSDSTLARFGVAAGLWATAFRWVTGLSTVWLNVGDAALSRDMVGVVVHLIPPLLLLLVAEAGPAWRRAMGRALAEATAQEQADLDEARQTAEEAARAEREEAARAVREQREWEREQAEQARLERERQREHEAALAREEQARAEARERAEREARERAEGEREQQRRERERREQEAARRRENERREREAREHAEREREQQRAEHERREQAERAERERAALLAGGPVNEKLPEPRARQIVTAAVESGLPVRTAAELCGWSTGWVSSRYQEHRDTTPTPSALEGASA
ncbi:hypothetical protein OG195_12440 [Streptomyces sp. NBC_01362]|uniref:hypothetical protein n=1 Tax=Streptomyces sp. NBC_01362 TaxID=2903839 RepID=UPI002E32E2B0|nr:hypothetical protein [Streptomyces sp. NBC_01362]